MSLKVSTQMTIKGDILNNPRSRTIDQKPKALRYF
jgi:hypothetical protein